MSPRQVQVRHCQVCVVISESAFQAKQTVSRTETSISDLDIQPDEQRGQLEA